MNAHVRRSGHWRRPFRCRRDPRRRYALAIVTVFGVVPPVEVTSDAGKPPTGSTLIVV